MPKKHYATLKVKI